MGCITEPCRHGRVRQARSSVALIQLGVAKKRRRRRRGEAESSGLFIISKRAAARENFRSLALGERVLEQHSDNQTLRQQMALTNFNLAEIYFNLGKRAERGAEQLLKQSGSAA